MSETLSKQKRNRKIKRLKGCQRCSHYMYGLSIEDWQATLTVASVNLME